MATAQNTLSGYVTGRLASTKIDTPETVMVRDVKADAEHLVVVHPCGTAKPVVTVSKGPEKQQIIRADGVPVAIVANGSALSASDIKVIECEESGQVRF